MCIYIINNIIVHMVYIDVYCICSYIVYVHILYMFIYYISILLCTYIYVFVCIYIHIFIRSVLVLYYHIEYSIDSPAGSGPTTMSNFSRSSFQSLFGERQSEDRHGVNGLIRFYTV